MKHPVATFLILNDGATALSLQEHTVTELSIPVQMDDFSLESHHGLSIMTDNMNIVSHAQ